MQVMWERGGGDKVGGSSVILFQFIASSRRIMIWAVSLSLTLTVSCYFIFQFLIEETSYSDTFFFFENVSM